MGVHRAMIQLERWAGDAAKYLIQKYPIRRHEGLCQEDICPTDKSCMSSRARRGQALLGGHRALGFVAAWDPPSVPHPWSALGYPQHFPQVAPAGSGCQQHLPPATAACCKEQLTPSQAGSHEQAMLASAKQLQHRTESCNCSVQKAL